MSIYEQLAGTSWRLETYQSETKDGEIMYPLGEDAEGVIFFTTEDQVSVQIMAHDRDKAITPEELKSYNTEVEKEMARLGYHAYTGPFSVDEDEGTMTTHVKLSVIPSYVGSDQARHASINGDTLELSNVKHPERKLVWKRIQ